MPKILTTTILAAVALAGAAPAAALPICRPTPQGPTKPDQPLCEQPFSGAETGLDAIMSIGLATR